MEIMVAPEEQLKTRTYNVTAMSFTPEEIAHELRKHVPGLEVSYSPDQRQVIGEEPAIKRNILKENIMICNILEHRKYKNFNQGFRYFLQ